MPILDSWGTSMVLAGKQPTTVVSRTRALGRLEREVGPLLDLTRQEIEPWIGRYAHPSTRFTNLSYVRCFYTWAVLEEHLETNPTLRIPSIKVPRRLPRPIPTDELFAAMQLAGDRERLWIELMAYAGLRVSEVAAARPHHVQRGNHGWWLDIPRAKGGAFQTVDIPEWLALVFRLDGWQ